jgi:hypothetical protein
MSVNARDGDAFAHQINEYYSCQHQIIMDILIGDILSASLLSICQKIIISRGFTLLMNADISAPKGTDLKKWFGLNLVPNFNIRRNRPKDLLCLT